MVTRKNAARTERTQMKVDSGPVNTRFPDVEGIVINMTYNQHGIKSPLTRTVHFYPESYAYFRVECLSKDCSDGGFDFTKVIASMVRSRKANAKGELNCKADKAKNSHATVVYEVAIQYS